MNGIDFEWVSISDNSICCKLGYGKAGLIYNIQLNEVAEKFFEVNEMNFVPDSFYSEDSTYKGMINRFKAYHKRGAFDVFIIKFIDRKSSEIIQHSISWYRNFRKNVITKRFPEIRTFGSQKESDKDIVLVFTKSDNQDYSYKVASMYLEKLESYVSSERRKDRVKKQIGNMEDSDRYSIVTNRNEQANFRKLLFDKEYSKCSICHEEYPIEFLVAAHIKKRSECSEAERRDPNIVMPLCVFGCDQFYEKGYILVKDGRIVINSRKRTKTKVLNDKLSSIEGNIVLSYNKKNEKYFLKHYEKNCK